MRVEVSADGGATWADAELDERCAGVRVARAGRSRGTPEPGEHELQCRATDAAGNGQPASVEWNTGGYCNNAPQRVRVLVS